MNNNVTNVTSMSMSAEEERRFRIRRYVLTMAIRTACFLLMIVVRGPMLWALAAGAIFLPMIAVMLATHVRTLRQRTVESPDARALVRPRMPEHTQSFSAAHDATTKESG